MSSPVLIREGVRCARAGSWELLDALELLERRRSGELDAIATTRWLGRTLIGYGDEAGTDAVMDECAACEGDGALDAEGANGKTYAVTCPECDGFGGHESADEDAVPESPLTWKTLNGDPADAPPNKVGVVVMDYVAARAVIDRHAKQLAEAA